LNHWLKRNKKDKGFAIPIGVCNELATNWYSGRNRKDWKRPDVKETSNIFSSLGLIGDFWKLQ